MEKATKLKWFIFRMATPDAEMVDTDTALSEEVMKMTTDDLIARTRLLDNDCKIMRSGIVVDKLN